MTPKDLSAEKTPITVVFDNRCAFCCRNVAFMRSADIKGNLIFCPREEASPELQALLIDLNSIVVIEENKILSASTAVLRIFKYLPWPWKAISGALLVPKFFRDACYRQVAKNRYLLDKWFCNEQCEIPLPLKNNSAPASKTESS